MPTINLRDDTHKELKTLSQIHSRSMLDFIHHAVIYFKHTGINPEESVLESPQKAIRQLSRTVEQMTGVFEAQEKERLEPLMLKIRVLLLRMESMLNDAPTESSFKSILNQTEKMMEEDSKRYIEQLKTQHKFYTQQNESVHKSNQEVLNKVSEVLAKLDKMA